MQWVKNLTVEALVTAKARVRAPAWCSGLKDLVLPQLLHRSQLGLAWIQSPIWECPHVTGTAINFFFLISTTPGLDITCMLISLGNFRNVCRKLDFLIVKDLGNHDLGS